MSQLAQQFKLDVQNILTIGDQQLVAAKDEDWEAVEKLEKERQTLVLRAFDKTLDQQLTEFARLSIGEIQSKELKLKTLTEKAQTSTREQLQKLQTGDKATKAYKQFL